MVLAVVVVAFEFVSLQRGQVDVLAVAGHTHVAHDSVTPSAVTTPAPPPPASPGAPPARILEVPWHQQAYELSCEEASLRMALAHESISTTDAIIINIIGIDTRSATFDNGAMHWGDPFVTFVGDPNGSETGVTGYGTYYPTIARAAATLGGQVLSAGEGIAPAGVYDAILHGHPVVAWVTYRWVTTVRDDYVAFDGRPVLYAGPVEHAVTVVGVNETSVLVNDPISGPEWVSKSTFEAAYSTYQQMAVVLA